MKLLPFSELVAMSKEKIDEAMAPIRARQVKGRAELEMAQLDADLLTKETSIQEMCTAKDINFPRLLDSLDDMNLLERRKIKYQEVLAQLFPVGDAA